MRASYGLVAVLVFIVAALTAVGCSTEVEEPECTATVEAFVASLAARDAVGLSRTMARDVSVAEAADLAAEILGTDDAIEAEQIELESPIAGGGDWNYMVRVISSDLPGGEAHLNVTVTAERGDWVVIVAGPVEVITAP
ncbi:MAG TPA: hypothetical protein DCP20_07355 [Coriobacteriia bacterium]|jgi:hypothetical protein|nr:MAG: hypothetical protein XD74_1533 [Actinobacteria bacterium 66_15]HAL30518.1 hypothetical protein [Coriobacteriia bacterium]